MADCYLQFYLHKFSCIDFKQKVFIGANTVLYLEVFQKQLLQLTIS